MILQTRLFTLDYNQYLGALGDLRESEQAAGGFSL